MIETRPNHYALSVDRLDETIAWYARVFGFEEVARWTVDEVDTEAAMLQRGDFKIELFEREGRKRPEEPDGGVMGTFLRVGLSHVALTVASLDEALEELDRLGVETVTDVNQNPVLGDRWVFVRDPNGVFIELVEAA